MPHSTERISPSVLPKLIVSNPVDNLQNAPVEGSRASRRRDFDSSVGTKEQGRPTLSEWSDIDESPPRRRKSAKRSLQRHEVVSRSSSSSQVGQHHAENQLPRFFPRLARILEVNESVTSSRQSTKSSDQRRHKGRSSGRRSRHGDDSTSGYQRPNKHRTGGVHRRSGSLPKDNPSLLSVLSSKTRGSSRSSGSNSTITQQSYDHRNTYTPGVSTGRLRRAIAEVESSMTTQHRSRSPNVFDYMEADIMDDGHDSHSVASATSSSRYEPSDAGSSEAPGTPSSRSTFPSPTQTRSQSVTDLQRKFDSQFGTSACSVRSDSSSPEPSIRSFRKRPSVSDVPEDDEERSMLATAPPEISYDPQRRSSSRSSQGSRRHIDRLHQQEESMRQHLAYSQQGHYIEPGYGQHRSFSSSSAHSDRSGYAHQMAMQHYQWPPPEAPPAPPQAMNGHISTHERPPAPEAPDISRRTLNGYEELALELSATESPVKPIYRKFEYLNHRILLHLQDELCELEEQLRTVDEIIAQMDPALADGQKTPASRRGEAFHGSEVHLRRTHLLGHVFVKTEQYNKAMSSYASMVKDSSPADQQRVTAYREWLAKNAPIHDIETHFVQHNQQDLIVPGKVIPAIDRPTKYAAFAYLPVALMLPLLLYSIIPSLAGRLAVTALIAVGAFMVAATTRVRHLMPAQEWAICGGVYVLLMAAIAGCISSHPS